MADKSISELVAATSISEQDLFVVEQGGTAKKMTGQLFTNWLTNYADGHGGIQSIAKTGTSGLVDTYTITYADTTTATFTVTNAKSISSITQYFAVSSSNSTAPTSWSTSVQTMTTTNKYLWSYFSIAYNNGSPTTTTPTVIGVYGNTGAQTYVWIKYSAVEPTSNSDMGDVPDEWIGIYVGTSSTAPTAYTSYTWYQYKGETGSTGNPATLSSATISYQQSDSGSVVPTGDWVTIIPSAVQGKYLWTRIVITFNTGNPITAYSVSRYGIDGSGAVATVNGVSPDSNGNVQLTATDIICSDNVSAQTHISGLESTMLTKQSNLITRTVNISAASTASTIGSISNDSGIKLGMVVLRSTVANPPYQTSDWIVTTSNGGLTINGTASAATTVTLILAEV